MHILIAPDSFKESLSAEKVTKAIKQGLLDCDPKIKTTCLPISDGGEGFASLLTKHTKSKKINVLVKNALHQKITASYGYHSKQKTAYIDVASASGLEHISSNERNLENASSYGTGELIKKALVGGAKKIVLGLGGSATNDGGIGMAEALGFVFKDKKGNILNAQKNMAHTLLNTAVIEPSVFLKKNAATFLVATDVLNPLLGKNGATFFYGKQKGGSKQTLLKLEQGLSNLSKIIFKQSKLNLNTLKGGGAAGGIGGGSAFFLNAKLVRGSDVFFEISKLEHHLKKASHIITAEGSIDKQILNHKALYALGLLAKKHHKPIFALYGIVNLPKNIREKVPIDFVQSIGRGPEPLTEAFKNTASNLRKSAYELACLWKHL